ncbi:17-beta-hydroxysteroid dehydrogenase type 6-like [Uloborus diversus]|uniref:17-beta-hydroxysteroid dehydrogenase type 6-like n=1 Tax=Uloborus diversus TaxID=327109 RepID=UPI00240A3706|nr:17-beta-hydroxysteroid dehydrogenase type 6-like [Uloborus diversus]
MYKFFLLFSPTRFIIVWFSLAIKMFQIRFLPEAAFKTFLMFDRRLIASLLHIIIVALVLELLKNISPYLITSVHSQLSQFTFLLFLSHFTYDFVKSAYLPEKVDPENKAVFITGCDTGFGHHLARRLDSRGFHVFASCLFPDGEGAETLKENCSDRLQIIGLDVTKDDSVAEAFKFVKKHLASCDLLAVVNNAGIQKGFDAEFSSMTDFKDTMEVNAFGAVRVTKAFLPLLQNCNGRIINVTSLAGRISHARICPYTMSKYAVTGFTECIRQEMEVWGLQFIAVEPELFLTPIAEEKFVMQRLEASLSSLDNDIKTKYGDEYFHKYSKFIKEMGKLGCRNIDPVIDALELAVSLKYPDSTYKPRRNCGTRIFLYFCQIMPQKLLDIITCFIFYASGLPTPKERKHS